MNDFLPWAIWLEYYCTTRLLFDDGLSWDTFLEWPPPSFVRAFLVVWDGVAWPLLKAATKLCYENSSKWMPFFWFRGFFAEQSLFWARFVCLRDYFTMWSYLGMVVYLERAVDAMGPPTLWRFIWKVDYCWRLFIGVRTICFVIPYSEFMEVSAMVCSDGC